MLASIITANQVYFYAKMIGAIGAAGSFVYGSIRYLQSVYNEFKDTSQTVTLLATNHLPHIQKSLDDHGQQLTTLSSDVRDVSTKVEGMDVRLDDSAKGVQALNESFLRHLENAEPKKKSRKV